MPKGVKLPLHAKFSVDMSNASKGGGPWQTKTEVTVEFTMGATQVNDIGKVLAKSLLEGVGIPAHDLEFLDFLESSSEAAFVLGPIDFKALPAVAGWAVDQAHDESNRADSNRITEGLTQNPHHVSQVDRLGQWITFNYPSSTAVSSPTGLFDLQLYDGSNPAATGKTIVADAARAVCTS